MVESSDGRSNGTKSSAYLELERQLLERDTVDFKLVYLEHMVKLQRCYSQALKDGWTADEMTTESTMWA